MADGEHSTKELLLAAQQAIRDRDQLRALWLEWLEGVYDGPDLLRRVRLAVHGPLQKPVAAGVTVAEPTRREKDMALTLKRMCRRLKPDDNMREAVTDYLRREGLLGSPLRSADAGVPGTQDQTFPQHTPEEPR